MRINSRNDGTGLADGLNRAYYLTLSNKMMAAAIEIKGESLTSGQPVALFTTNVVDSIPRPQYDVARDGRFLIDVELNDATTPPITLLQNWTPPK